MDTYFVNVVRTLVDFRAVEDMRLADAYDTAQHLHSLVVHMVALPVDSYWAVDILDLGYNWKSVIDLFTSQAIEYNRIEMVKKDYTSMCASEILFL